MASYISAACKLKATLDQIKPSLCSLPVHQNGSTPRPFQRGGKRSGCEAGREILGSLIG